MNNIKKWNIEEIFADRFAKYSKSIILDRALPDVRDGLKPVQRRIIYSMYLEKNIFENNFRKSAKTVGSVIAYFHPHGDSSIYEAMIRMSQTWKLRENLIQIHGNNGSMDGDSPAAMRYTEAKMSKISNYLVNDIDKNTVDFVPNFDDTSYEPCVLPGIFPNFLVNGGSGIAAGYATDIPPHNPKEVIETIIAKIQKPNLKLQNLLKTFNGPDFPTGGTMHFETPIEEIYKTGRGKVTIYSKILEEKNDLLISEIPYDVNKAELVKTMDQIRLSNKLPQLKMVRDESDRNGICIRLKLSSKNDAEIVKKFLFKKTNLSKAYNFNMVGIVNNKPKLLGLETIIDTYINHQQEVFTKKYNFLLKKYNKRLNIVEGLTKAVSILDEIIKIIRSSSDKAESKKQLIQRFKFNEEQAEAIVMMRLYRLSNTDITLLLNEKKELNQNIENLTNILNNINLLNKEIVKSLKEILKIKEIELERKTIITEEKINVEIDEENLIVSEDVVVTISKNMYLKRSSLKSYNLINSQNLTLNNDVLLKIAKVNTKDNLIMFTNFGRFYTTSVHKLEEQAFKKRGNHVSSIFELNENEQVIKFLFVSNFEKCKDKLVISTNKNQIKQIEINQLDAKRVKSYIKLKKDAIVNSIFIASNYVVCSTSDAYSFAFPTAQIPISKISSSGVKIMNVSENLETFTTNIASNILYNFENKSYKRVNFDIIPISNRGTKGKLVLKKYKTANLNLIGLNSFESNVDILNLSDLESKVMFEKASIFKLCDLVVKAKEFEFEYKIVNSLVQIADVTKSFKNQELIKPNENEEKAEKTIDKISEILDNILGD